MVEDAEEEDEVERAVLAESVRVAEVAEDPRVRRAQSVLPRLVEAAVLLEVREREERRREPLVDPARMDAVLRPDLEHPQAVPVASLGDVRQPVDRERQVDVVARDGGVALVADATGVTGEGRVQRRAARGSRTSGT